MVSALISRFILLVFGTLYPAYASYKTVKTKNVKAYVRWMMYWIVFALYTCVEVFADVFVAFWLPFYYELKILFVLWLISPTTKGSNFLYKNFINPQLNKHEKVLDIYIASIWDHGYNIIRNLGSQGFEYLIQTLLKVMKKGQITAAQLLPKIEELAQQNLVIQNTSISTKPPAMENELDSLSEGEDGFDILSLEPPYLQHVQGELPIGNVEINEQRDSFVSDDSDSALNEIKSRPLKLGISKTSKNTEDKQDIKIKRRRKVL